MRKGEFLIKVHDNYTFREKAPLSKKRVVDTVIHNFIQYKTSINRCITRKHPLNGNPNLLSVNGLTGKGC